MRESPIGIIGGPWLQFSGLSHCFRNLVTSNTESSDFTYRACPEGRKRLELRLESRQAEKVARILLFRQIGALGITFCHRLRAAC